MKIVRGVLFIILFAAIVGAQAGYDEVAPPTSVVPISTLPPAVLEFADLGLNSATASFLWLKFIQDFASPGGTSGIAPAIRTINTLDPHFAYPYAFGVLMIPAFSATGTPDAIAIGTQGVALKLPDWEIPYYLAVTYDLSLKDQRDAEYYFNVTANTPGVPEGVRLSSLTFGTQSDELEQTKQIWTAIYQNSNDEVVQEQAQAQIGHIDLVQTLDQAIATYKKNTGVYPKTIEDLVKAGILQSIPADPYGIVYGVGSGGTLTSSLPQ